MSGCTPIQDAFFKRMTPLVEPMAKRMKIDAGYLLALAAFDDACPA